MHTNLYILIDEIVKLYIIKLGINKCFDRLINNYFLKIRSSLTIFIPLQGFQVKLT